MRAGGDAAQILNRRFRELTLLGEQPVEHRVGQRLFEFEADIFLMVPGDPAELIFQPGNAEPDPAIVFDIGRALDPAAVSRHIDHANFDPAAGPVAQGCGET